MLAGVTMENPASILIDADVEIDPDCVIESNARILGTTRIGPHCRIGAGSILENAQIGQNTEILPYSFVADSRIGANVRIGPFARLRNGNFVEDGARIGNFVELKKTTLGPGSKANHLAYLGDSRIGAAANVGAGTITCNYDGKDKHPTHIGDRTFIGSNSTLVAPLEIENDTYIAAGSVITKKVAKGSLAIGRSRQVAKEGWVEDLRKKHKEQQ
jgi:bifunctional UDP-N-acetylglucosamine pyrophosphorylase/glucosamine-1-phosphate N-acetyltransferase